MEQNTLEDNGIEKSQLQSSSEIEFTSLSIDEMEKRFEVGQPIENEFVAYGIYCIYGRAKGFSIKKVDKLRFPDGSGVKACDFLCSCEGKKDEKRSQLNIPVYVKPTIRCECKAKLRVSRLKGQNWKVSVFKKEHSHDTFSPDVAHLLRTARNVSDETNKCFEKMISCGIPIARAYEWMQMVSNGSENVGYTRKDVYDSLSRSRARKQSIIEDEYAMQLVQHFANKSNNEPYFYWNVAKGEDNRVNNLFFRDYRCAIDYEYFGDVLTFDTTYRTNIYNLICCPFIGVNHHKQSILFGFAFLSDETKSSFEWLFRTFLESMGGKQPETIFTDQCAAMYNAIGTVFNESHHCLCHWHINQNSPSHFGSLNNDSNFKRLWYKCMNGCESKEEFEQTWKKMVDDYAIDEKYWFKLMYKLREKWATVFRFGKFSAGIVATSRSESANAVLKRKFGSANSSLYECVIAYEKAQDTWRMEEKHKDSRSHHSRLPMGNHPWLIQASEAYTLEIFSLFQKEVHALIEFSISEHEVLNTSLMRFIVRSKRENSRGVIVHFDTTTFSATCSCHKFETFGILCSHLLKFYDIFDVASIPECYIKTRWTKNASLRVSTGKQSFRCTGGASGIVFAQEMMRVCYDLATKAFTYKETRAMFVESIEVLKSKMVTWLENLSLDNLATEAAEVNVDENSSPVDDMFVRNPLRIRTQGVTEAHERHWDVSKKKAKGAKQRGSSLQQIKNNNSTQDVSALNLQDITNFEQPLYHPIISSHSHATDVQTSFYECSYLSEQVQSFTQLLQIPPPTTHGDVHATDDFFLRMNGIKEDIK